MPPKRRRPTREEIVAARDQLTAAAALDENGGTRADAYVAGAVDALDWTLGKADLVSGAKRPDGD